jgi:hypothetical protein
MVSIALGRRSEEARVHQPRMNVVGVAILFGAVGLGALGSIATDGLLPLIAMTVIGIVFMPSPRIAQQWERAVVLRFGRFVGLRGPGLFWIAPFVDRVPAWIDQRTIMCYLHGLVPERVRHNACAIGRGLIERTAM